MCKDFKSAMQPSSSPHRARLGCSHSDGPARTAWLAHPISTPLCFAMKTGVCKIEGQITPMLMISFVYSGESKHFEKGAEDNLSAPSSFVANVHIEIYAFTRKKRLFEK